MPLHRFLAMTLLFAMTALTACGSESAEVATTESPAAAAETTIVEEEDDHDDGEEHSDEEGDDHDDEDHDDHGDDHDDDEDHDDHGDDHDDDDEDHDDHGDDEDHDDHSDGLGAHEHGAAEMTVASIDGDVAIELISPTFNIFGFEYEPETDEDIAFASDQTDALTASGIIAVNDEADCSLSEPVSTSIEQEGTHSEMTATWLFTCANADEIDLVDVTELFAAFPNFEDIDVEWVSATDQSSAELTPEASTLRLTS